MGSRLVIITLLASIGFFNFHDMVVLPVKRAMFMFMIVVCLVVAMRERKVRLRDCSFPRLPWFVFCCGLVISVFMGSFYHIQSLTVSVVASSTCIFAFGSFFVLLLLDPEPDSLIKYMFGAFILSVIVYAANLVTFPDNMFGEPILSDLSRGALRIRIPLLQLVCLLVFYSINRWNMDARQWKWLVIAGCCFLMVVMSLTRMAIVLTAVIGFFQILQKYSIWKKLALGVIIAAIGYAVMIHLPIYQEMKELSEDQIDATVNEGKEDVRIGAWRYYGYEVNETMATFLFGNGTPSVGKSVWGKQLDAYAEESGYLFADVSLAGMVFMYGLIPTVAMVIIVLIAIFKRKPASNHYLTYFMIFCLLRGVTAGIWYYYEEIFITMIALYLIYRSGSRGCVDLHKTAGAVAVGSRKFVTE